MIYTARGLIDNARSLADLQNTKFISYEDELSLVNEAYRDVYSRYTESDGDYWMTETIFTMSPAYDDPNNQYGYLIPLPADFLKIRALSYNYGGVWYPCDHFAMSSRDFNPSKPMYRLKNGNLWIIGAKQSYAQLKLDYYPIPDTLSAPDVDIALADALSDYQIQTVTSHCYANKEGLFFYIIGNVIYQQDLNTGITTTLYTAGGAIDQIAFFAGYVYYRLVSTTTIYRCPPALFTSPGPVIVKASVNNFYIQQNRIYYSTVTETRTCGLDGSIDTLVQSFSSNRYTVLGGDYVFLNGSNVIYLNNVTTGISANYLLTDSVYIYALTTSQELKRYSIVAGVLVFVETMATGITSLGSLVSQEYVSILSPISAYAMSLVLDSVLDYPTNEVNEILAYTSAMGYARKQSDQDKMGLLAARLAELWDRFWSVNKRDEYQFARINNDYQQFPNQW
jgi:hypothetical protein